MRAHFNFTTSILVFFSLITASVNAAQVKNSTPSYTPAAAERVVESPKAVSTVGGATAENWKGVTETSPFEVGAMVGATLYGTDVNWSLLGTGAFLILDQGWADEVDDRVWIELEIGPAFFSVLGKNSTGMQYSTHLRWDFTFNEYWTVYGLGGLGGYILPSSLGSAFAIHPRFGAGVQYQTKTALMFRAEISHEFMGAGIGFNF